MYIYLYSISLVHVNCKYVANIKWEDTIACHGGMDDLRSSSRFISPILPVTLAGQGGAQNRMHQGIRVTEIKLLQTMNQRQLLLTKYS